MTKLSHLLWYWQAEWGLSACTCGLLALVWKQGLWEKIYSILLFKLDLFLCQFMTRHTFFCKLFLLGGKHAYMHHWYEFIFQIITGKTVMKSIHASVLPWHVLTSEWGRRETKPTQTDRKQSLTICKIYIWRLSYSRATSLGFTLLLKYKRHIC